MCDGDGTMGNAGPGGERLGGLAGGASADKGRDEVLHVGPPVILCEEVADFEGARVASCWRIVV